MHWDPKRNKWSSLTQQRRDERKEAMSLFRKKPKEPVESAFDRIPQESQDKFIEDVLDIVRTVRAWPDLIPADLHGPIAEEISTMLRKTGLKLAGAFMGSGEFGEAITDALKSANVPKLINQCVLAVKLTLSDKEPTEGDEDGKAT